MACEGKAVEEDIEGGVGTVKRRYVVWDYVANWAIEYKRLGECNRCGDCCVAHVGFTTQKPYSAGRKAGGHKTSNEGAWQEVNTGRWRHFYQLLSIVPNEGSKCPDKFTEDRLCAGHEDEERPWICKEWPFSPRCVEAFDECSYSFEEIGRWRIGKELGI